MTERTIDERSLGEVRELASSVARSAGLSQEQTADFRLAVHEVAANCLHHGGGHGSLLAWHEDGTALCEVRDGGLIDDPLVGRVEPDAAAERGRGPVARQPPV